MALGLKDNLVIKGQPFKAKILTDVAQLQRELEDPKDALRCARIAQELIRTSAASDNPPELVWCYNTIGRALQNEGKFLGALDYFQKAVDLEIKTFEQEKAQMT